VLGAGYFLAWVFAVESLDLPPMRNDRTPPMLTGSES
jgi:hypothetical protein